MPAGTSTCRLVVYIPTDLAGPVSVTSQSDQKLDILGAPATGVVDSGDLCMYKQAGCCHRQRMHTAILDPTCDFLMHSLNISNSSVGFFFSYLSSQGVEVQ